jgi:hypothetical protein
MACRTLAAITGSQTRAGPGVLGWGGAILAQQAGVARLPCDGLKPSTIPRVSFDNLVALQRAMEAAGVIFLDAGDELATTAAVNDKCGGRCHYRPACVKPPDAPDGTFGEDAAARPGSKSRGIGVRYL